MAVKIEITGETAVKAHEEFVEFARLLAGVKTPQSFGRPVDTNPTKSVQELAEQIPTKEEASEPEKAVEEVKEAPKKKRRTQAEIAADKAKEAEAAQPEEKAEETSEETAEQPEEAEKVEEAPAEEAKTDAKYPGDFAECKNDAEVLTKVRAFVNAIPADKKAQMKTEFLKFKVKTIPDLSADQLIEFYTNLQKL